jgi:phosphoribosylanthranilate isomerase
MWIKLCGNTNLEDAQLAVHVRANAAGFVFAPSPRRVTPEQVSRIVPHLPESLEKIGIFVDAGFEEMVRTVMECGLTGVQMHQNGDPALAVRLRDHLTARGIQPRILQVLHYRSDRGADDLAEQIQAVQQNEAIDAVLVDSRTATAVGGTGIAFDWQAARHAFAAASKHLVAAGGLNSQNVAEAIRTLRPWGVDVVTGVESAPGKKDPEKVKHFVQNARTAAQQLHTAASG